MNKKWLSANFYSYLVNLDIIDLSLRLTLLDLILTPVGDIRIRFIILLLSCSGLLFPAQLRNPGIWALIAVFTTLRLYLSWPINDNHAYLLAYWCLAITICLLTDDTKKYLAVNARYLIGFVFAFATVWKLILSPDFMDGTFFKINMLIDPRFEDFTMLAGGLSVEKFQELHQYVKQHVDGQLFDTLNPPDIPGRFITVAVFLTYFTVVIEFLVAAAFLWPLNKGLSKFRDYFLLLFCASVYSVATVEGFGWLLLAMGISQLKAEKQKTKILYLLVFALVLFYREVPWVKLLLDYSR